MGNYWQLQPAKIKLQQTTFLKNMLKTSKYTQIVIKASISSIITSIIGIICLIIAVDPLENNWSIWALYILALFGISSICVLLHFLFFRIAKREIIFSQTVNDFIFNSLMISCLSLLVIILNYTSQLNLISIGIIGLGLLSYIGFRALA